MNTVGTTTSQRFFICLPSQNCYSDVMNTDALAQILWNYHHINQPLKKADCILVLGSHDLSVARYGAKLFLDGYAPLIAFSGGTAHQNDMLRTGWNTSEAEMFANVAIEMGVPKDKIIIENKATNTGENFQLTEKIFKEKGVNPKTVILVQKPYMERRTLATGQVQWPQRELIVTSEPVSYADYINRDIPRDSFINIMVGDLQRIKIYGDNGFQTKQEIPAEVWSVYEQLVQIGFDKRLVK